MIGILSPQTNHKPASTTNATIPVIMSVVFDTPQGTEYASVMGGRHVFAPPLLGGNDTYIPIDFTAEDMSIHISTNAEATSDQTIEFMVQEVDTSLIITVGATQTGLFQDLVNTHAVKARQKVQYHFDPKTASSIMTIQSSGLKTSSVMIHGGGGQNKSTVSGTSLFFGGFSSDDSISSTENLFECVVDTADTMHLLTIKVVANNNTTGVCFIRTRVNGLDGTLQLAIAPLQTGRFTQLNGEQALVAEDLFTIEVDNTDGNSNVNTSFPTWVSKIGISQVGGSSKLDLSGSAQEYQGWTTGVNVWTTSVARRAPLTAMALTIDAITAYVPTNNSGTDSTIGTRIDDVDETNPQITYGTGQTGVFRATTDSSAVASGDRVQMREDAGDTSVVVQAWCVLMK